MDRYTVLTAIASALLSAFAFIAANDKPSVQYIEFEEPMIITVSPDN
jgi:hypothetical protein